MALDAGVIIIPAISLLIGVFLPDSPRWFAAKCRFVDAERRAATPALHQRGSETRNWMKSVKLCRLNRVAGRRLKRTAPSAARCSLAYCCRNAAIHRDERHHVLRAENLRPAGHTNMTQQMWGTVIVGLTNGWPDLYRNRPC
ncbi:hypothetical protein ACLK1T_17995 [Escherichia coli]